MGFPGTCGKRGLDELWPGAVELAIALVVPAGVVLRRLSARGRADDRPEAICSRLLSYERETRPVLDWFATCGLLVHVDGNRPPEAVTTAAMARIRAGDP